MNVLHRLFLLAAVAVAALGSPENAKACDVFFPSSTVIATSSGGFFAPAFVPSYGYASNAFFVPAFKQRAVFAAPVVAAPAASATIINERRGLFGRLRSREVIQATAGGGGASAQIIRR